MHGQAQAWLQPLGHGWRAAPSKGLAPLLTAPSQQAGPLVRCTVWPSRVLHTARWFLSCEELWLQPYRKSCVSRRGYKIFTVLAIKIEESTMFLRGFPMCACAVSTSSSSHCHRWVAKFSDPCCKLALKCHNIPGALFIFHQSNINRPDTSSYFEQRWNAVNKCHPCF